MTTRRTLGAGPPAPAHIRAAQADLLDALPGIHLRDLDELRARGVFGIHPATSPTPRRILGADGRAHEEPPGPNFARPACTPHPTITGTAAGKGGGDA